MARRCCVPPAQLDGVVMGNPRALLGKHPRLGSALPPCPASNDCNLSFQPHGVSSGEFGSMQFSKRSFSVYNSRNRIDKPAQTQATDIRSVNTKISLGLISSGLTFSIFAVSLIPTVSWSTLRPSISRSTPKVNVRVATAKLIPSQNRHHAKFRSYALLNCETSPSSTLAHLEHHIGESSANNQDQERDSIDDKNGQHRVEFVGP